MSTNYQSLETIIKSPSEWDKLLDRGFVWLTRLLAFGIAALLLWIGFEVASKSIPAVQAFGIPFIFQSTWDPVNNQYGVLPQIYGTLASSLLALLLAVPIGVGTAILLSENFLPLTVRTVLVFLVELLAAIPSVVYGLWGIFVVIPLLKIPGDWLYNHLGWLPIFSTPLAGPGLLPAAVVLTIMILPIITAISRDSLNSLPPDLRQAAIGLGATRWETIFQILLPAAFSGITGAVMLALGRAMGETMAVTMLIGNANVIKASILAPSNTISSLLANQFAEANGLQISALMYAAFILFILTFLVNVLADLVVLRVKRI